MPTVITDEATLEAQGTGSNGALWLSAHEAAATTGWTLKPEGFCKGEICVSVPPARSAEFVHGDKINIASLWRHLGAPVVHDEAGETWVLGTSAQARSERLRSLEAPDFSLPDLDGVQHSLAEQRGKKVLLVSWASW